MLSQLRFPDCAALHPGYAERIGAQARGSFPVPAGHGAQAQRLLSGTRAQRDAISARGRLYDEAAAGRRPPTPGAPAR